MGVVAYERVAIADGAEEGYQWLLGSLCLFAVFGVVLFCQLKCTFSDLSVRDLVERVRRMVLRKLTWQPAEESVTSISVIRLTIFHYLGPSQSVLKHKFVHRRFYVDLCEHELHTIFLALGSCHLKRNERLVVMQKQRFHNLQMEETAALTKTIYESLTVLNRTILWLPTAAERDRLDVRRLRIDRCIRPSIVSEGPFFFVSEQCSVEECFRSSNDGLWVGKRKADSVTGWDSLPRNIHENILLRFVFQDLFRLKQVSKDWRKLIESDVFRQSRGRISEGVFTAINYYIKNKSWRCSGYDLHSRSWRSFPQLSYLTPPDAELLKEFSVCGHGALMCADVSKLPKKGEIVVFNPLTGETRALPPLLHPRNPVLVYISVDSAKRSYKVIVAGSTGSSQDWRKPNCKIMEVFDSSTSKWIETCNIPGPSFGLSKHQTGICVNGILFFICYLDSYRHPRGQYVLGWDMENWRYLEKWACPIPFVPDLKSLLQLVENDGKVYLFSQSKEDVQGPGIVRLRIDEIDFHDRNKGVAAYQWRNVVEVRKTGGREICMYPDFRRSVANFMCVGFGKGKLCIFNTLDLDGVVYDMLNGMQCEVLESPPSHQTGDKIFSLNPASFTLHPSFASDP